MNASERIKRIVIGWRRRDHRPGLEDAEMTLKEIYDAFGAIAASIDRKKRRQRAAELRAMRQLYAAGVQRQVWN